MEKQKKPEFVPVYKAVFRAAGLHTLEEFDLMAEILHKFRFEAPRGNLEVEMSDAYLRKLSPEISKRQLSRCLARFEDLGLLAFHRKKNPYGKSVRFVTVMAESMLSLVHSKEALATALDRVQAQAGQSAKMQSIYSKYNSAATLDEKLEALDKMHPFTKVFILAWDAGQYSITGKRLELRSQFLGTIMRAKQWDGLKDGAYDLREMEQYFRAAKQHGWKVSLSEYFKGAWTHDAEPAYRFSSVSIHDAYSKALLEPRSFFYFGEAAA